MNALSMNYSCVIYGERCWMAMVYYAVDARKWFKGPWVNVEHFIHGVKAEGSEGSVNHVNEGENKLE